MTYKFYAELNPSEELCSEVSAFMPNNPFYTYTYIDARRLLGFQPWIFILRQDGDQLKSACTAFMKSGLLSRSLEIPSLPMVPDSNAFWGEILRFCQQTKVSHLEINSFASTSADIPTLSGEMRRRKRSEYVIELQNPDLWDRISSNHARNIKRGRKACLQVQRTKDEQACQEQAHLISASMARRKSRGESVPEDSELQSLLAFTQTGSGELFQAVLNGKVLSSILLLMAEEGSYYQSAGTSPEGMKCGASHYLIHEIATILKEEARQSFNLGGADPLNPGLVRFKTGFGASTVELEAAVFFLGGKIHKNLGRLALLVKDTMR